MQSPRYVAKYGAIRFLSCPGRAAIVSKFRAVSGTACKMPSPTPPKSAKVELRTREHLTPGEVDALIEAAKANRYSHRDATVILLAFRHGLRAAEVCDLRWDQVSFDGAVLHVRRVKGGTPSTHPLLGDELLALRRLQRESVPSPFVFVSERGTPFTTAGFARMIERAARRGLGLELKAHPHMLRHACGYALANRGHDTRAIQGWLGHRSITSTAVYTALAPNRFKDFWREWAGRSR